MRLLDEILEENSLFSRLPSAEDMQYYHAMLGA